jgi:hypothetical protein
MIVPMINAGDDVETHIVSDICVGQRWAKHWKGESLEVLYGSRQQYQHEFPVYFPQGLSNPQTPYCYPDDAQGELEVVSQHLPRNTSPNIWAIRLSYVK